MATAAPDKNKQTVKNCPDCGQPYTIYKRRCADGKRRDWCGCKVHWRNGAFVTEPDDTILNPNVNTK